MSHITLSASRGPAMLTRFAMTLGLALALNGCNSLLDTNPIDEIPESEAIISASGARAALAGAYNSLQGGGYYYDDFYLLQDLSADNAIQADGATSNSYADADGNQLRADNPAVNAIWSSIYSGIHRTNVLLRDVPGVPDLSAVDRDQILGEAHFLRGLHYFNLVRLFGGVPLRLAPATSVEEASVIARSTEAETYAQIIDDLQQSETLMTSTGVTTQGTPGAAKALLAEVYLYQQDWSNALAKSDEVIGLGYSLAPTFGDLFDTEGIDTPEDIFKVLFTDVQYQLMYLWITCSGSEGGGCELAPSQDMIDAYADPFDAVNTDVRLTWSIMGTTAPDAWGIKYPTTFGAEDLHVIRFAEVLLIKAEASAELNDLATAVGLVNQIRTRAGIDTLVLGTDITTQQEVLDQIDHQRRLELFAEGDRWMDLVRTGRVATVMPTVPAYQYLYPIPQSEIDVAPNLVQNPGY
ncbi:MAG: RagB/SusD family nutrient uptake outer membrane protein [Gemmatimonadota bacterium]